MPKKPPNEILLDAAVTRDIFLNRWSDTVVKKILRHIRDVQRDILAQLAAGSTTEWNRNRLTLLLAQFEQIQIAARMRIEADLDAELSALVSAELESSKATISDAIEAGGIDARVSFVDPVTVKQIVMAKPFQGALLREWLDGYSDADKKRLRRAITIGMEEGETVSQIASRIKKALGLSANDAEAIVRTAISHIQNRVRHEFFKTNDHLIKRYMWLSILDKRTSDICKRRSNKIYVVGRDPNPVPPAHIRCRSTIVHLIEGQPIPDPKSYDEWLRNQPIEIIEDILGVTRAKLYKDGGLSIDDLITAKGRRYTLDELRAKERGAWKKARIDEE